MAFPCFYPLYSLPPLTPAELHRYSRHIVLPDCGLIGQKKLKSSSVLCIGAGGLGSPILLYLAAAGIGHLGIVDSDVVDRTNLQRQIIHSDADVGRLKVDSARDSILALNPSITVTSFEEELTPSNFSPIIDRNWDVVIDGTDNFPSKYLISDACEFLSLPWIYSAVQGFTGHLGVFNYGPDPISYRDFIPDPPQPGDVPSCAEGGILGVVPGVMGVMQATEVIKIILGLGKAESKVIVYDAISGETRRVGFKGDRPSGEELRRNAAKRLKSPNYGDWCGSSTLSSLTTPNSSTPNSSLHHRSLSPTVALKKLSSGWSPFVLDVRTINESSIATLPFTDSIVPHRDVRKVDVPVEGDILVYCKGGKRSELAIRSLIENGVEEQRLWNLEGGILKWQEEVDNSMVRY